MNAQDIQWVLAVFRFVQLMELLPMSLVAKSCLEEMDTAYTPQAWLTFLMQRHLEGRCQLPKFMGLTETEYRDWQLRCGCKPVLIGLLQQQRQALLSELLLPRETECEELSDWLSQFEADSLIPMTRIIAVASMGFNHLWQDLGLDSRQQLRELIRDCFPQLIALNQQNMRWKKFFYRQLCSASGNFVCRSPSCDDCVERANCFTPEI